MATTTNHAGHIYALRERMRDAENPNALEDGLAADLLELHDRTGISLDNWDTARMFVERQIGASIQKNGV